MTSDHPTTPAEYDEMRDEMAQVIRSSGGHSSISIADAILAHQGITRPRPPEPTRGEKLAANHGYARHPTLSKGIDAALVEAHEAGRLAGRAEAAKLADEALESLGYAKATECHGARFVANAAILNGVPPAQDERAAIAQAVQAALALAATRVDGRLTALGYGGGYNVKLRDEVRAAVLAGCAK